MKKEDKFVIPTGQQIVLKIGFVGGSVFLKAVASVEEGTRLMNEITKALSASYFTIKSKTSVDSMIRLDQIQFMHIAFHTETALDKKSVIKKK